MPRKLAYNPEHDYYDMLGVASDALPADIHEAYRKRAKQLHPDVNQERAEWAKEQFQRLAEAYAVLRDPVQRKEYDNLRWPYASHNKAQFNSGRRPAARPYTFSYENYRPRATQTSYTPPRYSHRPQASTMRPGAWLEKIGLGKIRPAYASIVELINSPYRYVLMMLAAALTSTTILTLMVAFSSADLSQDDNGAANQQNNANTASTASKNIISGDIPTPTLAPTVKPTCEIQLLSTTEVRVYPQIAISATHSGPATYRIEALPIDYFGTDIAPITLWVSVGLKYSGQMAFTENEIDWEALSVLAYARYEIRLVIAYPDAQPITTCSTMYEASNTSR
jgi:curved DNA-binding protein CbpA